VTRLIILVAAMIASHEGRFGLAIPLLVLAILQCARLGQR